MYSTCWTGDNHRVSDPRVATSKSLLAHGGLLGIGSVCISGGHSQRGLQSSFTFLKEEPKSSVKLGIGHLVSEV